MFKRKRVIQSPFVLMVASLGAFDSVSAADTYETFVAKHCIACHGPEKQESELRIDTLSRDFALGGDAHHWAELIERVNIGDMPPEGEPRPTQEEIEAFVTQLSGLIREGRAARMAARPPVAHYRLSRKEYQNTVYDLLGVRYDPTKPGELNEDTLWHGYERIGSELSLSPSHVDRYYRAAELCSTAPSPLTPPRSRARSARPLRSCVYGDGGKDSSRRRSTSSASNGRCVADLPRFGPRHALASHWFGTDRAGTQRALQSHASGQRNSPARRSAGTPEHWQGTSEETVVNGIIEFDITAPEDKPQVYEFEVFLEMPT
jgi:hypothetical protein